MSANNKYIIAAVGSIICVCLSIGLFLALCWVAAADAQGAIAFFLYAPLLAALVVGSFFLGRFASPTSLGRVSKKIALVFAAYYLSFYIAPFVGLGFYTDKIIGNVGKSFKAMTGKSPMEWNQTPQ
jgi:hypothetical protein